MKPKNTQVKPESADNAEQPAEVAEIQEQVKADTAGTEEKEVTEEAVKTAASKGKKKNDSVAAPEPKEAEAQETEIPENAKKVMKLYPDMEQIYIDPQGGIFTTNTPEHVRGGAILYKNPYFKK